MIEFHDVCVCYEPQKRHPVQSLDKLTLKIEQGDWVFLVGPSGAGKSSLLKLIFAGTRAQSGRVIVDGEDVTAISHREVPNLRRKIGIVFQDFQLLNEKTAWENVAFTLRVIGTPQSIIVREVPRALETVGLTHRAEAYPHELSGGEQQRIAIARAIVNDPKILLADEPTGNLDPQTAREVGELLTKINRERGTTIVMATHDRVFVDTLARRVVRLNAGHVVSDEDPGTYGESDGYSERSVLNHGAFLPINAPHIEAAPTAPVAPSVTLPPLEEASAEEARIAEELRQAELIAAQARAAEIQAAQAREAAEIRATEMRAAEERAAQARVAEARAAEARAAEARAAEARAAEARAAEARAAEARAAEARAAEARAAEARAAEARAAEVRAAEAKAEQDRAAEARAAQERAAQAREAEIKAAQAREAEARAAQARAAEIRAAEIRAAEIQEAELRAAQERAAEIRAAEARAAQERAAELRAAEARAAEIQATEARAAEARAAELRAAEARTAQEAVAAQERRWQQTMVPPPTAPAYSPPPPRETPYVVTSEPQPLEYSAFDKMLDETTREAAEAPARAPQFTPTPGAWVPSSVSPDAYDSYDDPAMELPPARPMARRIGPSDAPPPPPSTHPLDPNSFVSEVDAPLGSPENPIVQYE